MLSPPRRPPSRTRSVTRSSHTLRRAVSGGADRSVRAHPRLRTRLMPLRVDRHARTSLCSGSRQTRPKKPCCCLELWLEPSALENVARTKLGLYRANQYQIRVAVTTLTARRSVLLSPLLLSTSTTPSTRDPVDGPPAGVRVAWTLLQKRTWVPAARLAMAQGNKDSPS